MATCFSELVNSVATFHQGAPLDKKKIYYIIYGAMQNNKATLNREKQRELRNVRRY
jgi:hypothetical protein